MDEHNNCDEERECNDENNTYSDMREIIKQEFETKFSNQLEIDTACEVFYRYFGRQVVDGKIDQMHINKQGEYMIRTEDFKRWMKENIDEWFAGHYEQGLEMYSIEPVSKKVKELFSDLHKPIYDMVEPMKKDDWFYVIYEAIKEYEKHHEKTPNEQQLWSWLIQSPPEGHMLKFVEKRGEVGLELLGGKHLDREAFNKRYKRLYPSK